MNKLSPQEQKIWFNQGRLDELARDLAGMCISIQYDSPDGVNVIRPYTSNSSLQEQQVYAGSLNKNLVALYALNDSESLSDQDKGDLLAMLGKSDNNAFIRLKGQVGAKNVNDFVRDTVGVTQTELAIRPDGTSFAGFTTNSEALRVFRRLMNEAANAGEFGQAVIDALAKPDSRYGVRQRIAGGVVIHNKTGTDFTTAADAEVRKVTVAHDVGHFGPRDGSEGDSFFYSTTSTSETAKGAKKADHRLGEIGVVMAHIASDKVEELSGIQVIRNRFLHR